MRRVGVTPRLRDFLNEIPLVNDWLATVTDRLNIFKSAANPTTDEVPENQWLIHKNTTSGTLSLWANDEGVVVYTPLGPSGTGDVTGPAGAVNNNVVFFNGASGKVIKDSGLTLAGNNTGDQTSIVGISGTKAQFDIACSDGNFVYVGDAIASTGNILTSGGGVGYTTGAGGTVAQATSKATGVTLDKFCGDITMDAANLAADTTVSFVLTNSTIAATDYLAVQHVSAGTLGSYTVTAACAAGSATIYVRNITAGALAEAIVLKFVVIKAVTT